LILESAVAPRRRMLEGVARYIKEHEDWGLYLKPLQADHHLQDWLDKWDGDGVITVGKGSAAGRVAVPKGISLVYVGGQKRSGHMPLVIADSFSIGATGAQHLLERGFKQFGFVRYVDAEWGRDRCAAFERHLHDSGYPCSVYNLHEPGGGHGGPGAWEKQQLGLVHWITSLPKPVGIMTSTDLVGQQLLEACQRAAVPVPEQVAVVGADNDELICRLASPPLSSVIIDDEQRGYQAAALLDRLMNGEDPPTEPILIPAKGIAIRASTELLAIDDPLVVKAVRYIREHAYEGITVEDVAQQVPQSRRVLERRFRKMMGRTVNDHILASQLDRAVMLLTETDLSLKQISLKTGFGSVSYMGAVFKRVLGRTPGSYLPPRGR
jgi:LacI family transcriptional regulator